MYRAVFIDIDGTLKNDSGEISDRTKEAVKEAVKSGIIVVICSGRPIRSTIEVSKKSFASEFIITSNGAYGYNHKENKCVFKNPMKKDSCIKLYNLAKENDVNFIMNTEKGRFVLKETNNEYDTILSESIESFVEKLDVMQCLLQDSSFEKIRDLKPYIEKIESVAIKNQSKSLTNPKVPPREVTYYDVADEKTSKGFGVKKMCKALNIDLKDAISIGDDYNDISMFEQTGLSVVMGNANDEVKSKAKYETLSNNEDGVAIFLEKLLKNKEEFIC